MRRILISVLVVFALGAASCQWDFMVFSKPGTEGMAFMISDLDHQHHEIAQLGEGGRHYRDGYTTTASRRHIGRLGFSTTASREATAGQVEWTATGASITSNGLYTAGQTPGEFTVTATETSSSVSAPATVTITDAGGGGNGIAGVTWACADMIEDADGGDLWPVTWSDDGHQYTAWGDGNGFQGGTKKSWGIARLQGSPRNYVATDLAEGPDGIDGGKVGSIVSVGGVLYVNFSKQDAGNHQALRKSTDRGATLGGDIFVWPKPDVLKFVQHGQDNEHGGGYVYAVVADFGAIDPVYLVRVRETDIEKHSSWEWLTGTDPVRWGSRNTRVSVFSDPGATRPFSAHNVIITYVPALGQYILTQSREENIGRWSLHVGPTVHGPWSLIERYDSGNRWCGIDDSRVAHPRYLSPRWTEANFSGESLDFWLVWSGRDGAVGDWDRFNLIKGTFKLR